MNLEEGGAMSKETSMECVVVHQGAWFAITVLADQRDQVEAMLQKAIADLLSEKQIVTTMNINGVQFHTGRLIGFYFRETPRNAAGEVVDLLKQQVQDGDEWKNAG